MSEDRLHLWQEVRRLEMLDGAVTAGDAEQSELAPALVPIACLLHAGLFEVLRQGELVAGGGAVGQDIAAGVSDPGQLLRGAEWKLKFNDRPRGR